MKLYHSPYEAYPFLSDASDDLRCDFELLTDELTSMTGLLAAQTEDFRSELLKVAELIYHANPTLRTRMTITPDEIDWLHARLTALQTEAAGRCRRFVLPQGCQAACTAHLLRVKAKCLVRLLYRFIQAEHDVPDALMDFCNLLSGYFFHLALVLNLRAGVQEIDYVSRNY